MNELNRQLIAMYAKQLRVPTFNQYEEVVRQLDGGKSFDDFLVSLMRAELENRQESNRKRKIRSARFPWVCPKFCVNTAEQCKIEPKYFKAGAAQAAAALSTK